MRPLNPVTHVNVDDLERGLAVSSQLAPAFIEQALLWLAPSPVRELEPGVRERLMQLVSSTPRTQRPLHRLTEP